MCVVQFRRPGMDTSSCLPDIGKIVGLGEAWAWPKVFKGAPGAALGPHVLPPPRQAMSQPTAGLSGGHTVAGFPVSEAEQLFIFLAVKERAGVGWRS